MNQNKNHTKRQAAPAQKANPEGHGFIGWLALNILACLVGYFLFTTAVNKNASYNWLWNTFAPSNLESFERDRQADLRTRLMTRLGVDFNYLMMIHDYTPANAVVYYPSLDDFKAKPAFGEQLPFNGRLVDKMTAIRFLYPRKVVVREELGKTPYADKITHVSIINGRNTDMLQYPVDSTLMFSILPARQEDLNKQQQ